MNETKTCTDLSQKDTLFSENLINKGDDMTRQEQIDEVMDWFDFERVSKMMLSVEFGWYFTDHPNGCISSLREHGRDLLKRAIKRNQLVATGGFEADARRGQLSLSFIPDEITVEDVAEDYDG
jgi:hypothetical protein